MEIIWKRETAFMKDIIDSYPEPKPAPTTIATVLKRLQEKNFVGYDLFGNSRRYFSLVNKRDYFSKQVKGIIRNYFEDSALDFASFFTVTANLSTSELEKLREIVNEQIRKKKK